MIIDDWLCKRILDDGATGKAVFFEALKWKPGAKVKIGDQTKPGYAYWQAIHALCYELSKSRREVRKLRYQVEELTKEVKLLGPDTKEHTK